MVSFLPKFSQAADDFAKRNKLRKLGDSKEAAAKWVAALDGTLEAWDEWYHSAGKELTELAKRTRGSILSFRWGANSFKNVCSYPSVSSLSVYDNV